MGFGSLRNGLSPVLGFSYKWNEWNMNEWKSTVCKSEPLLTERRTATSVGVGRAGTLTRRRNILALDEVAQGGSEESLVVAVVLATLPHQVYGGVLHAAVVALLGPARPAAPHQWLAAPDEWVAWGKVG